MAGTTELFNNMKDLWNSLEENHTIFSEKSNKAAGSRARKAAGEFKKIVTDYRKASVAESK
jgi:hypothetical protein